MMMKENEIKDNIKNLSNEAHYWLYETCMRFDDGQEYSYNEKVIRECLEAGLLSLTANNFIQLTEGVTELVYSEPIRDPKIEDAVGW